MTQVVSAKRKLRRRVDVLDIGQGRERDGRDDQELLPTLEQEYGRHDVRIAAEPPEVDQRGRKKDGDGTGHRHAADAQERAGRLGCVQHQAKRPNGRDKSEQGRQQANVVTEAVLADLHVPSWRGPVALTSRSVRSSASSCPAQSRTALSTCC